ncbi:hypothetical protein EJ06DRAFT_534588 [Trichodelitschia bisporula]|uniref:RTA1-domain-containing protein n=1 Tax=Trichodelitschia bisporula TaxID=703511 RepID=A0A6G1HJF8_9PEZI|nr:hypothetical protein EJ06DRAFT_534588 [Trichodelitschia bisporula]
MSSTTSSEPSHTVDFSVKCVTATPGKYGNVPIDACNSYYNFDPQYVPALAVAVIFGILTIAHIAWAAVYKKWYCWVLIMGALWETLAFTTHALGAHNQQSIAYATAHSLLYLLAPLWINAFAYMTFARLVYFYLPSQALAGGRIHATSLAKYFVIADVLSFIIQAAGGVMASPGADPSTIKTGINIYMAGIGVQEAFVLCFVALMVVFHRAALRLEREGGALGQERRWRALLFALYAVLAMITVRIAYRIAEYGGGMKPSNPIPFHEAYAYALDAAPMMVAILILAVVHPGRTLVGPESEFPRLSWKEKKVIKLERKAVRKEAKRVKREGSGYYEEV